MARARYSLHRIGYPRRIGRRSKRRGERPFGLPLDDPYRSYRLSIGRYGDTPRLMVTSEPFFAVPYRGVFDTVQTRAFRHFSCAFGASVALNNAEIGA
jgi:hypothetical protein